jgi:hypothetical protein
MLVRLPLAINQINIRNVEYRVSGQHVVIPDDYLPDLLLMFPTAEPITTSLDNANPPPPVDNPRNKV